MFVMYEKDMNVPIKVWLEGKDKIEENCLEQAYNLAKLPFVHKWVCLMPDTHTGKGMPIGGVIATKNAIIPNAVGSDIGCGMVFVATNIKLDDIKEIQTGNGSIIQTIIGNIMRTIPTGRNRYRIPQESEVLDKVCIDDFSEESTLVPLLKTYKKL